MKKAEMEARLSNKFDDARLKGRMTSAKWLIRHAMEIYAELHPHRVVRREGARHIYLGFKFSPDWLHGFKKRYHISYRAGTKRAQQPPDALFPTVQRRLQFNRRNSVVGPDSDCGKPRGSSVPVVGRYKLSEITNMDQSPLSFGF